jgi:hypothetical protein
MLTLSGRAGSDADHGPPHRQPLTHLVERGGQILKLDHLAGEGRYAKSKTRRPQRSRFALTGCGCREWLKEAAEAAGHERCRSGGR